MKDPTRNLIDGLRVPPGKMIDLQKDYDPGYVGNFAKKEIAENIIAKGIRTLSEQQVKLYAQDTHALLIILQGLDSAGKDSIIKHVMSGVNPQGVSVKSFKEPGSEERNHDYLWRHAKALPERGTIGIFNRSYYEEVLIVRVHPEYLGLEQIPAHLKDKNIWNRRYEEINCFENYLVNNGIVILKFFLNVSQDEQKKRFLERIEDPTKNWKFSASDIHDRNYRDAYMEAYQDLFNATSTPYAPWYVIPADHKWFTRLAVTAVILATLDKLKLAYPDTTTEEKAALTAAKKELEREDDAGRAGKRTARGKNGRK